jgi:hypothetical protein
MVQLLEPKAQPVQEEVPPNQQVKTPGFSGNPHKDAGTREPEFSRAGVRNHHPPKPGGNVPGYGWLFQHLEG